MHLNRTLAATLAALLLAVTLSACPASERDDAAGSSSSDDRYFSQAPWVDAEILPAPI